MITILLNPHLLFYFQMPILSILNQGEEVLISGPKISMSSRRELRELKQKHFKDRVEILRNQKTINTLINSKKSLKRGIFFYFENDFNTIFIIFVACFPFDWEMDFKILKSESCLPKQKWEKFIKNQNYG